MSMPIIASLSTMRGIAAAASTVLTVSRTISEPARHNSATCFTLEATSEVSVLVIDCTTTGLPPPTVTPPIWTAWVWRRGQAVASEGGVGRVTASCMGAFYRPALHSG